VNNGVLGHRKVRPETPLFFAATRLGTLGGAGRWCRYSAHEEYNAAHGDHHWLPLSPPKVEIDK
jgi:hypothetical protein